MQKLTCPRDGVSCLTFSPDGDWLAGIGQKAVLCWTRSLDWEITGIDHAGPLTGLAFHPTGRTFAFAGISNALWARQAPDPRPTATLPPSVLRRRFAKEKPRPFTGIHFYTLTGIDEFVPNRAFVPPTENVAPSRDNWVRGLAFTPDGRALVAGHVEQVGILSSRTNVYHWHFTETDDVWQLAESVAARGPTERGGALVDGHLILSGEWGVAVCPTESTAGLFVPDVSAARVAACAPRGELVATLDGREVVVWSLRRSAPVANIRTAHGSVSALAFAPDGRTLAIGHDLDVVVFAESLTGAVLAERDFGVGWVTTLAYAPDGLTLAVGGVKGVVVVDTD